MSTHPLFRVSPAIAPERPVQPTLADFPLSTIEKLRFADTDRNGHITNSVFAICCQNARMELLCDPRRVPVPPNAQFVTARLLLEFRAEMHWPGTVAVGTRVERIGRSSLTLMQGLFVDERCVAVAESVVALMDKTSRRSTLLPDATAQALRAFSCPTACLQPREGIHGNAERRTIE
jgi:acyl-CoA thioester hydrolase